MIENTATPILQIQKQNEKLIKEIEIICNILYDAQESLKIVDYLYADDENGDLVYTKHLNAFFYWARVSQWKTVIIELFKLFGESENFYIKTFLNKLGRKGIFEGIIDEISIKAWKERIKICDPIITKLRNQRNKTIAHKDRDILVDIKEFERENEISIEEVRELIVIVQQVAREIYKVVKQTDFMINSPINSPVDNLKWIIKELTDKRSENLRPLFVEAIKYGLKDELPKSEQQEGHKLTA